MRIQSLLLILALFLAPGCAGPKPQFYWYQPDKTFEEVKADYSECDSKAQEEAAQVVEDEYFDHLRSPSVLSGGDKPPARKNKSSDPRLQARADWGELYRQNAFAGCMQSRGYVKLRAHQVSPNLKTKELPLGAIAGK
jgi:hypothetical protein